VANSFEENICENANTLARDDETLGGVSTFMKVVKFEG
jgi:hypothetical protein